MLKLSEELKYLDESRECGFALNGLAEKAEVLEQERDALKAELEKANAKASKAQELADWHLSHRNFAESQLEAAQKQSDKLNALIAECTVDGELDSRLFNAYMEYASPVPAQQSAKLYAWQPQGHGEYSFFVVAHSEEEARKAVGAAVIGEPKQYCNGWGTDYYKLSIADIGEVILNDNA